MNLSHFPAPVSYMLWVHILGGTIALATFTLPLFSKKGGVLHVRSGWLYSGAMLFVVLASFTLTPWRYFLDPNRTQHSQDFALFLFYIAILTLASVQQGIHVFKHKKRTGPVMEWKTLALPVSVIASGIIVFTKGVLTGNPLLWVFPVLTSQGAYKQIQYWKTVPQKPQHWWFFHLENMFGACIATVTAFIVTALPRLFPSIPSQSIWLWLAPSFVMVPWMIWFIKKYEKKFAGG